MFTSTLVLLVALVIIRKGELEPFRRCSPIMLTCPLDELEHFLSCFLARLSRAFL